MEGPRRILVVDDTPHNVKLLADLLDAKGYEVTTAESGPVALEKVEASEPDIVLLDVMMPGMDGYEVCRRIRENPATNLLPVVMVTALDDGDARIKGIEAGADDFLSKPVNTHELLARVRSLLRVRELHQTVRDQAAALADINSTLERRVEEQVERIAGLESLKRFLSPQIASTISSAGLDALRPHRRRVTVVFTDLRGFTPFAESAEPEELMEILAEFHEAMGANILAHEGTIERFTGDGLMVFFNDPIEIPDHEERALRMAVAMRDSAEEMSVRWKRQGHDLRLGIGLTSGYATLGLIGFEARRDYAAIGSVTNQAARLCAEAAGGQVIASDRLVQAVEGLVESELIGELELKGLRRPIIAHSILRVRS